MYVVFSVAALGAGRLGFEDACELVVDGLVAEGCELPLLTESI